MFPPYKYREPIKPLLVKILLQSGIRQQLAPLVRWHMLVWKAMENLLWSGACQ